MAHERKKDASANRNRGMLLFIAAVLVLAAGVILYPVYARSRKLRSEEQQLRELLEKRRAERAAIQREVDKLRTSPEAVEKVARERYRLCREGETVMIYDSARAAAAANADGK